MAAHPTLLIADDQAGQRAVLEMLLSLDGYELVTVEDGREALSWLKDHTPDLAILDVNMPYVDGLDICRRMKRITRLRAIPVMILTAMRDDRTLEAAEQAGADMILRKPLEGKDFRQNIQELLARRNEASGPDEDGNGGAGEGSARPAEGRQHGSGAERDGDADHGRRR